MSMEVYLVIVVLFVGNVALLEAKTPLVIGELHKEKFCPWLLCFGMRMMSFSVQADQQYRYKNRSGLEYYAYFLRKRCLIIE